MTWANIVSNHSVPLEDSEIKKTYIKKEVREKPVLADEPTDIDNIRDMFSYDITELYLDICEEMRNNSYGFVYCKDNPMRGKSFMETIFRNLDYDYYLEEGGYDEDDDSGSDDYYWERRSKFAYV